MPEVSDSSPTPPNECDVGESQTLSKRPRITDTLGQFDLFCGELDEGTISSFMPEVSDSSPTPPNECDVGESQTLSKLPRKTDTLGQFDLSGGGIQKVTISSFMPVADLMESVRKKHDCKFIYFFGAGQCEEGIPTNNMFKILFHR
jgi:hypothetical protein